MLTATHPAMPIHLTISPLRVSDSPACTAPRTRGHSGGRRMTIVGTQRSGLKSAPLSPGARLAREPQSTTVAMSAEWCPLRST